MAYRRRPQQGFSKPSSTFEFDDDSFRNPPQPRSPSYSSASSTSDQNDIDAAAFTSSPSSLAAKAIRASSARRDSSLSSVYGHSNFSHKSNNNNNSVNASSNSQHQYSTTTAPSQYKEARAYEYTSMKNLNESKNGFWGALARKAKSIIDDDNITPQSEAPGATRSQVPGIASRGKFQNSNHLEESNLKRDGPTFFKGLDAITSSLTQIGGTIGKSLEEGFTKVENRTSDIIQETRKHIRKKPGNSVGQDQERNHSSKLQQPQLRTQMSPMETNQELQLKASRDVAMAMAAKAKLLLRELKTVKADLAFAKDRCAQLEEENKILRENRERGDNHDDDDLIRLQLETLLAEKARLAHDNSVYARENRFLREVVEYHQLTMQDVVYFDESNEEVTEVNPLNLPPVPSDTNISMSSELARGISSISVKDAKISEATIKGSKSSEVIKSISSITGKDPN
ncbi:hypothetical protein HN51_061168 [Arachis hypogaea]|uniref:Uncharacterized protein n=1 Tax=Arachis hypogaea TaxID=3818 RepID=A0A445AM69_ARAHY|nr:uncharacterized protein LOC107636826 [Arachis ipaensis]XP_025626354.1 uncharacterized protein LOC112719850 [Arachis hypogaea]QHO18360.1 uncharacterized protein DS421_11g319840 [Arachis hypogaea]RYR27546.1 hypothetical protein Ahy_B01g051564 isoform B [Arachis hypogaea]